MDAKEHQEREECGLVVFSGRLPQLPLTEQNISVANDDHDDQITSTKRKIDTETPKKPTVLFGSS